MKWLIIILSCCSALAQHPLLTGAGIDWSRASSVWYPTNAAEAMIYWFDTIPTPGFNSSRDSLTSGGGAIPADGGSCLSLTNWVNPNGGNATRNVGTPLYRSSGGGNSGTTPRWDYNNGATARFICAGGVGNNVKWTNFTVIMVVRISGASTANQGLVNNANSTPYLELNASKLTMNAGTAVSGAATIGNNPYIITWLQKGATSEIDTNGVLYVTGNSGTDGFANASDTPYLSQARVNHFIGDSSLFEMWTNTLSAGELSQEIARIKTNFGFP